MSELVSIVLPIYNVEKYLDRCIESVVNQTYRNLEIILVDDGSPDNCPQICDEWAKRDARIKVIHKQNQGLGMARNTGIENATGAYICFFDSDDSVEPDTIESCVAAARENQADLVVFGHDDVTPDMRVLGTHLPCPPKHLFVGEEVQKVLLPNSLYANLETGEDWDMVMSAWNKLYSMDAIRKAEWKFASEREILSEDFYSLTEFYGKINRVCVLNKVFYHYMVNNASLSHSYRPERFERIKLFYKAMISLSEKMGLASVLEQPVKNTSFSFIVGMMKIVVSSDWSLRRRYWELKKIIRDDFVQMLIRETRYGGVGFQKKMFCGAAKRRWVCLCFLLIYFKNKVRA